MTDLERSLETKNYPNVGQSFGILGILIAGLILMSPLTLILNKFIDKEATSLIYYFLSVGIPFWIVYLRRKRKTGISTFNFRIEKKRTIPIVIFSTITLYIGVAYPTGYLTTVLIPVPEIVKEAFATNSTNPNFFTFLSLVIVAPILEELLFRGIILDGQLRKYSPVKAILISSVIFTLFHLNPWQLAVIFLAVFMGWVYYKSQSVGLAIISHATNNLMGLLVLFKFSKSSKFATEITLVDLVDIYGGVPTFVLILVGSISVFAIFTYYLHTEFKKK